MATVLISPPPLARVPLLPTTVGFLVDFEASCYSNGIVGLPPSEGVYLIGRIYPPAVSFVDK